jgi:hypothetical protein
MVCLLSSQGEVQRGRHSIVDQKAEKGFIFMGYGNRAQVESPIYIGTEFDCMGVIYFRKLATVGIAQD